MTRPTSHAAAPLRAASGPHLVSPYLRRAALALLLLAYFLYFNWDALHVRFNSDEPGNIATYWYETPWQLLLAQFTPWQSSYRPMGAVFYGPLLYAFGLNPLPYHAVLLLVLLGGVFLVYRFARLVGCGELPSALAALIACYHAGLANLYYNTAFIYDALCGLFYLAGFVYYAAIRARGRTLRVRQIVVFLGLYLCALNSKEMAVTLPVALLLYEWFFQPRPAWRWRELLSWLRGPGLPILLASALNTAYIYGKILGPNALARDPGYRMVISWERVIDFQIRSFSDFFLTWDYFTWPGVLAGWCLLTYLAFRRKNPVLRFCWFFLLIAPLPIEFTEGRRGACLYIPLMGLAVFASVVFSGAVQTVSAFLAGGPLVPRLGRRSLAAILVISGVFFWFHQNRHVKESYLKNPMAELGAPIWDAIQQLRTLNPVIRPHTTAVFLNDPLYGYEMGYIAELWLRDRTVRFVVNRQTPLTPEELARADYQFEFRSGKLIQVK